MSHKSQIDFVARVKEQFPSYFYQSKILEIGSLDINGSVRQFFNQCKYIGVDLGEGKGVDIVARGEDLQFPDGYFDVCISCECFEHNEHWNQTFNNMIRMCSGLVIVTCATTGRAEHGTARTSPEDCPFVNDYYMNLTEKDFRQKCDLSAFKHYEFSVDNSSSDLYFYGIKCNID